MLQDKHEAIEELKRQFWETMAKAEALRHLAATQRTAEEADRFVKRAEAEEAKAKGYLKQAEILEKADLS